MFAAPLNSSVTYTPWSPSLIRQFLPSGSAGMDGWTGDVLRALDDKALLGLALLLDCADAGQVPSFRSGARSVGIPKEGTHEKRPLTILSSFYRCWATRQARSISSWVDPYLPAAADCSWKLQLALDDAKVQRRCRVVLSLGQRQCFDRLDIGRIRQLCTRIGCPAQVFVALDMYASLRRFVMIDGLPTGHLLDGHAVGGIPQGCPLVAFFCTLVSSVWEAYLAQLPNCLAMSYLDDRIMIVDDGATMCEATRLTQDIYVCFGCELNAKKCAWGSTTLRTHQPP